MTDIPDKLRALISNESAVRLAALFGSHAEGGAQGRSDVDLAVAWAPETEPCEREAIVTRIERALGRSVDAVDVQESPPLLRMEIARSGMLLVERIPHAWSDFRARAMLDWWDFAPYARRMHSAARARLEATVHGSR